MNKSNKNQPYEILSMRKGPIEVRPLNTNCKEKNRAINVVCIFCQFYEKLDVDNRAVFCSVRFKGKVYDQAPM